MSSHAPFALTARLLASLTRRAQDSFAYAAAAAASSGQPFLAARISYILLQCLIEMCAHERSLQLFVMEMRYELLIVCGGRQAVLLCQEVHADAFNRSNHCLSIYFYERQLMHLWHLAPLLNFQVSSELSNKGPLTINTSQI